MKVCIEETRCHGRGVPPGAYRFLLSIIRFLLNVKEPSGISNFPQPFECV